MSVVPEPLIGHSDTFFFLYSAMFSDAGDNVQKQNPKHLAGKKNRCEKSTDEATGTINAPCYRLQDTHLTPLVPRVGGEDQRKC